MLEFTCPKCGKHTLEEILEDVTVTSVIESIDEDDIITYKSSTNEDGDIKHYRCANCRYILRDYDNDIIQDPDDLIEYLLQPKPPKTNNRPLLWYELFHKLSYKQRNRPIVIASDNNNKPLMTVMNNKIIFNEDGVLITVPYNKETKENNK